MRRPALAPIVRVACLSCVAASLGLSVSKILRAPITYDEAYTYLRFARQPYAGILSDYTFTNNHILHTMIVRALTQPLGDSLPVLRLPAFAGAAALYLALWRAGRSLGPPAQLWTALVALTPTVVNYAALARSYTLGCALCFWALLLLAGVPGAGEPGVGNGGARRRLAGAGLLLGAAIGCVPVFGFFAFGVAAAWLLLALGFGARGGRRSALARVALLAAASLPPVVFFYLRIRFDPRGWSWGLPTAGEFARQMWINAYDLSRMPRAASGPLSLVMLLLAAAGLVLAWRRRERTAALVQATFLFSLAGLAAARVGLDASWPFARNMLVLVPLALFAPIYLLWHAAPGAARSAGRAAALLLLAGSAAFTAVRFDPWVHREWRSNAGVPAVLAEAAARGDREVPATVEIPWQLDVCVEYELLRRGNDRIRIVREAADYRVWLAPPPGGTLPGRRLFADARSGLVLTRREDGDMP